MTDRELQDKIIRYVTDPQARRSGVLKLSAQQAARAAQFSRFLARRYHRDRLGRSFRYSAMLTTERRATDVAEADDFEVLLSEGALGSFALARRVGQRAVDSLKTVTAAAEWPWWNALLEYERAHFLQTATSELRAPGAASQRGVSAICIRFDWDMPSLLLQIKAKNPIDGNLRREATLLFSRTRAGKIYVMEVDAPTAALFGAVDGAREEHEIAQAANVDPAAARAILNSLIEIGAIVSATQKTASESFQPERVLGI